MALTCSHKHNSRKNKRRIIFSLSISHNNNVGADIRCNPTGHAQSSHSYSWLRSLCMYLAVTQEQQQPGATQHTIAIVIGDTVLKESWQNNLKVLSELFFSAVLPNEWLCRMRSLQAYKERTSERCYPNNSVATLQ